MLEGWRAKSNQTAGSIFSYTSQLHFINCRSSVAVRQTELKTEFSHVHLLLLLLFFVINLLKLFLFFAVGVIFFVLTVLRPSNCLLHIDSNFFFQGSE